MILQIILDINFLLTISLTSSQKVEAVKRVSANAKAALSDVANVTSLELEVVIVVPPEMDGELLP